MNEEIIEALKETWIRHPHLRLGQLLVNIVNPSAPCPEIFYIEDKKLQEKLSSWGEG